MMTVKMSKEFKERASSLDIAEAKNLIKAMHDEEYSYLSIKEAAQMAAGTLFHGSEVLKAEAYVESNCRIDNFHCEGTGNKDVWINFIALVPDGMIRGGSCLSDICSLGDDEKSRETLRRNSYIEHYTDDRYIKKTVGDRISTPRFCTVTISAMFATVDMMREAGFTEPTYYKGDLDIRGKSIGINRMIFAAAPKDAK